MWYHFRDGFFNSNVKEPKSRLVTRYYAIQLEVN